MRKLYCLILLMCVAGCVKDVTSNPRGRTDFVPGQTYVLKQPVFLRTSGDGASATYVSLAKLGFAGTPTNIDEFIQKAKNIPDIGGLLKPGEEIRVTKFTEDKSFEGGDMFMVYAVITTGDHKDAVVQLNLISKQARPTSKAFRDPKYLEPIK